MSGEKLEAVKKHVNKWSINLRCLQGVEWEGGVVGAVGGNEEGKVKVTRNGDATALEPAYRVD